MPYFVNNAKSAKLPNYYFLHLFLQNTKFDSFVITSERATD